MRGVVFLGDRQVGLRVSGPDAGAGRGRARDQGVRHVRERSQFYRAPASAQRALGFKAADRAGHRRPRALRRGRRRRSRRHRRSRPGSGMRVMDHHYCGCGVCRALQGRAGRSCAWAGRGLWRDRQRRPRGTTCRCRRARWCRCRTSCRSPPAPRSPAAPAPPTVRSSAWISPGATRSRSSARARSGSAPPARKRHGRARDRARHRAPSGARSRARFGADAVIDPRCRRSGRGANALTHGEGADLALDCSGAEAARAAAVRATRTWGKVCFVGEGGTSRSTSAAT